jgi:uncharacterized protein (DUF885 family)
MKTDFAHLMEGFLRAYAAFNPIEASNFGWREFAGKIPDHSRENLNSFRLLLKNTQKQINKIDRSDLIDDQILDLLILENKLDADFFNLDILKMYQKNPLTYIRPAFVFDYLLKEYAPLSQRLEEMINHLESLPRYYSEAIKNLEDNLAPELVEMAIIMFDGSVSFLNNLIDEIKEISPEFDLSSVEEELINAKHSGIRGIKLLIDYLTKIQPNCDASFKLGTELYQKMLFDQERVDLSLKEILEAGQKNLDRNLDEMKKAAANIDPNKSVQEIMSEIRNNHPSTDQLIPAANSILEEIRQFLIDKKFVSIPSDVRIKVIFTPKPFREWAFAACDTPGALERKATNSYYYITPPDEEWTDEEKDDWLGAFNYPGLKDISVHEVWPGHYLHHLHNQRSKSLMSKLFGAYHFWEGYALHVEEAMWQEGFQEGDYHYRMAQLTETLLRNVRLIASIRMHTEEDFTVEDATELFMKYGFLGRKPSESEAKRGTFDPGYLNYCLGKLLLEKLQRDYMDELQEKGKEYTNIDFYDTLLSFGAPPIPILRKFMLEKEGTLL